MKKHLWLAVLVLALVLPAGGSAAAAAHEYRFDTIHSNFYFDAQHVFSTVRGFFKSYDGAVRFDPADLAGSSMEFKIQVDSVETFNGKRDTHLRSPDFFDASTYPVITFKSTRITAAGENRYNVAGTLTIKDVSRDVVLPFIYHGEKEHPASKNELVAGFDAQLRIDRLGYHVGNGKFATMGLVGKDVTIVVSLEMMRDK